MINYSAIANSAFSRLKEGRHSLHDHSLYRKHSLPHVLCFTLIAGLFLFANSTNAQEIDREVVRFIGEVAVGGEYVEENNVVRRWVRPARLSVFGADRAQARSVERAVQRVNAALGTTGMSIKMLEAEDDEATLKVIFARLDDFEAIAEQEKIGYVAGNWGYFHINWNAAQEIENATVLLSSDRLRNSRLDHFALEEITQSLGLAGDSGRFEKSLFYERPASREFGTATQLSSLDAKLLRFVYEHVEPGTHAVELGILLSEHWNDAR